MSTKIKKSEEPETKPKIRNLVVERIIAPQRFPDEAGTSEDGQAHYYLSYINKSQEKTQECSKMVWDWSVQGRPQHDMRANWILNEDENKLIVGVTRKPIINSGPWPTVFPDVDPNDLVLQKSGNTYEPVNFPAQFATPVLEEVVETIKNAGSLRPGNVVKDRFKVVQTLTAEDSEFVVVSLIDEQ